MCGRFEAGFERLESVVDTGLLRRVTVNYFSVFLECVVNCAGEVWSYCGRRRRCCCCVRETAGVCGGFSRVTVAASELSEQSRAANGTMTPLR